MMRLPAELQVRVSPSLRQDDWTPTRRWPSSPPGDKKTRLGWCKLAAVAEGPHWRMSPLCVCVCVCACVCVWSSSFRVDFGNNTEGVRTSGWLTVFRGVNTSDDTSLFSINNVEFSSCLKQSDKASCIMGTESLLSVFWQTNASYTSFCFLLIWLFELAQNKLIQETQISTKNCSKKCLYAETLCSLRLCF